MTYTYRHTVRACYLGGITQAVINNLAPLLFVIFQDQFGISFEQVGRLILLNFGVQILADFLSVKYVDRMGYRTSAILAHLLCITGLCLLAVMPRILPNPYLGLIAAVIVYALGGGLLEVLISPIVDFLPGEEKEAAMSLLHSFYCWGQVAVVAVTTVLLRMFGPAFWPVLPFLWILIPLYNVFQFRKVPLMPPVPEEKLMSLKELFQNRAFLLALLLMLCAGASELTMSQWSSLFAEKGLQVPKMIGDLLGPCLFAVLMGTGRAFYGIYGSRIRLDRALTLCGGMCVLCYGVTVFSPWPLVSLLGCAFCGLSVSLMWPGTFSLSSQRFPRGGTALFGMLAVAGDFGGSLGPWIAGAVSDFAQKSKALQALSGASGMDAAQLGLKCGLFLAAVFPLLLLFGVMAFTKGIRNGSRQSNG